MNGPHQLAGLTVFVTSDIPKMQLSRDCPVTPAFRAEMNEWMRSFFGTKNTVPDGEVLLVGSDVYANPRTFALLRGAK